MGPSSSTNPTAAPSTSLLPAEPARGASSGDVLLRPVNAEPEPSQLAGAADAWEAANSLDELDDLLLLAILRGVQDDACLLHLRAVSRRLQELAGVVLEERFKARWGVTAVVAPPPVAPAFAAPHPPFVLAVELAPRASLAALAVRYTTDTSTLKRLNNLLSDSALAARTHLYIPVAAATVEGRRVAFIHDTKHTQRRLVVVLQDGQEVPAALTGSGGSHHLPAGNQSIVVAKLARVLERALKVDAAEAAYYVQEAGCDLRLAFEKFEEDRRWERVMRKRAARLRP